MLKYKFQIIIDSFSEKEFKVLGKFLNSSFFNESKKMIEFYGLIKKYFHNHSLDKLSLETIYENIYDDKQVDYTKTRKLVSDFSFLLEEFLIHLSVESDIIGKKMYLTNQFKRKELNKLYDYEMDNIKKILDNPIRDSKSYYLSLLKITEEETTTKKFGLYRESQIDNIVDLAETVEKQHIFMKLYLYHILIQNYLPGKNEIKNSGFVSYEKFFGYIEKNLVDYELKEPRIYFYYFALKLIKEKKLDVIYNKIENIIEQNKTILNPADISFVVITLVTYIINKINQNKYDDYKVITEMIKKIELRGYLKSLTNIYHITYIEIIHFAILAGEYKFVEAFIWGHFSKITNKFKDDTLSLVLAMLRYEQGRYKETRDYLLKIKNKSYVFYIMSNSLLLRMYYEESSFKYINPLVDSFKHYLNRNNTVPSYFKESFLLFLKYLTKLTSAKIRNSKNVIKIEYILSNEKYFYGKMWIEEKIRILNSEF